MYCVCARAYACGVCEYTCACAYVRVPLPVRVCMCACVFACMHVYECAIGSECVCTST